MDRDGASRRANSGRDGMGAVGGEAKKKRARDSETERQSDRDRATETERTTETERPRDRDETRKRKKLAELNKDTTKRRGRQRKCARAGRPTRRA